MEGAIGVGAGDGMHMQVNGIHLSPLLFFPRIAVISGEY
jgi:hypothetical protein